MKRNLLLSILLIITAIVLYAQDSNSVYYNACCKGSSKLINSITKYSYQISSDSSFSFHAQLEFKDASKSIDFLDSTRVRETYYYDSDSSIRMKVFYDYEDGKLKSRRSVLSRNGKGKITTWDYSKPYQYVQTTSSGSNSSKERYFDIDHKGRVISNYFKDENGQKIFQKYCNYDEQGRIVRTASYDKGIIQSSILYFYNDEDQWFKKVYQDSLGAIYAEENRIRVNDNETEQIFIDYNSDTTHKGRTVRYEDAYGNLIKRYTQIKLDTSQWFVTEYEIEYK